MQGLGTVNPETLQQACEPFYTTKTTSTELGLVKPVVDEHGVLSL